MRRATCYNDNNTMGARFTADQLGTVLGRKGYGVQSSLGKRSITSSIDRARQEHDLESDSRNESLGAKRLQIGCAGLPEIRITFYRRRLADHHRSISEKALVDALQYAGAICGDSERDIRLTDVCQKKVGPGEEERTEIDIIYPEVDYENLFVEGERKDGR